MEQTTVDSIRDQLETERLALARQLEEHGASVDGDEVQVDLDEGFADSAQATAERAELLSLVEQLHLAYGEVVGALERLESGTYGRCENCGREIAPERLEAIPTARLCVTCKQATRP
jgi:DnaK suppressor protein